MEQPGQLPALPRALDVQRFAGAREQEIRALCAALKGSKLGVKFGVAALPRHLRRRAGSHKPFHNHRFRPNAKLAGKRRKLNPVAEAGEEEGGAAAASSTTAATQGAQSGEVTTAAVARPFTNRRMRRQPAALQERFRQSAAWTEASLAASAAAAATAGAAEASGAAAAPAAPEGISGSPRRLEMHVWHAKRLAMEERYGWLLPGGAAGQGRGSRSFVHVTRASALMHDASYMCPLLLRGAWRDVHSVLSTLLDPVAAAALAADISEAGGAGGGDLGGWEQEVMLHQPGRYPQGAICPAQLLLCPASVESCSGGGAGMDVDGAAEAAVEEGGQRAAGSGSMQALLWVHPAAAAEAAAALRAAAGAAHAAAGDPPSNHSITVSVLDLRRLEIWGGASDAALAVALAGATAAAGGSAPQQQQQQPASLLNQQQEQQQEVEPLPSLPPVLASMQHGEAVQLLLPDPRLRKPVVLGTLSATLLPTAAAGAEGGTAGGSSQQPQQQRLDVPRLLRVPPPLSEPELSSRRQQLRRRLLHLEGSTLGGSAGDQQQRQQQLQEQQQERQLQLQGYCPAVLVRHDGQEPGAIPGWSLVLPAGWVPPFWLAAAYAGCKPTGQREWRWLHTLQQRRCFPWDHPDTPAYAALMRQQQRRRQAIIAKRPPGKQMLAAPPSPPDWQRLVLPPAGGSSGSGTEAPPEQQQGMEVDAGAPADVAVELAGDVYVARCYAAMAAALSGSASGGASGGASGAARPVTAALRQGLLQWRPKLQAVAASADAVAGASRGGASREPSGSTSSGCLLEATVHPVKSGSIAEGAALCYVAGREALLQRAPLTVLGGRQQRRRQRQLEQQQVALVEAGGDLDAELAFAAAAEGLAGPSSSGSSSSCGGEVTQELVQVVGYVLSEAPRGAPRRCGALAAVQMAAAWRLRSLQHWAPRADGGTIEAFARNPGSDTLFPVRLRLLAEGEGRR